MDHPFRPRERSLGCTGGFSTCSGDVTSPDTGNRQHLQPSLGAAAPPGQEAAAGAQGPAAGAQPTTQAFFEGGNGYVTSFLTGQTQEIGAGQNALVDNLGNVSTPTFTPPEQRDAILQTWTSAQTMGSYSTAEGGAGVGGATQEQTLPPQPPSQPTPETPGGESPAPLADQIQDFLNIISTLTFDQLVNQPLVLTIYNQTFSFVPGIDVTLDTAALSILANNTWNMTSSGSWSGNFTSWGGDATFQYGSDYLTLYNASAGDGAWSADVSGLISSVSPYISFTGCASGTYIAET